MTRAGPQGDDASPTVLLINPKGTVADEIAQKCLPPMGMLWLAAALRQAHVDVSLIDANALRLTDTQIVIRARSVAPQVIAVALYAETLKPVSDTLRVLSLAFPEAKLIAGGPLPTAWPTRTLDMIPDLDFVIAGEAEDSFTRLVQSLNESPANRTRIPGVYSRRVVPNRPRASLDGELDRLPLPARDLVEEPFRRGRYYTLLVAHRHLDCVVTSRGCPHRCRFCSAASSKAMRFRSIASCLQELTLLRERGVRTVEVLDDNFTADEERARQLFERLKREKLGLSIRIKSRASSITAEMARAARHAGVYQISLGLESGAPQLLRAMGKGITVAQAADAVEIIVREGMKCHSSWIVGFPGETPETLHQTTRLIQRIKPTTVGISILRPYPGTEVYDEAVAQGSLVGDWAPDHSEPPWVRLPWTRSFDDLREARRRMLRAVYYRPHYFQAYAREILGSANVLMLRYAAQELRRTLWRGS